VPKNDRQKNFLGSRYLISLVDIVGINGPVFFINDGILFPDVIHALKPQPNNAIPQAATAHDTAWDFFSQQSSSLNLVMLIMAGYGMPRSFRHMDGWGVHTYRLVTADGKTKLVKWHWKSLQGKVSLLWEEAQKAAGKNADYYRQDLYNAIAAGVYPEWEVRIDTFCNWKNRCANMFAAWCPNHG
jgi:catalase